MVLEKSRLSKQLRVFEERAKGLITLLSHTVLPVDSKIQACFTSKLSEKLVSELKWIRAKLDGCRDKSCFEEVERSIMLFSKSLAALEEEAKYLRAANELELKVLFRELANCREEPLQIPEFSRLFQLCYAEVGLSRIELELEAVKADFQRLHASEGIHPNLRGIWERLLQREEQLLGGVEEELVKAKGVASSQPCEALKMLGTIARLASESRSICEEYKALKLEFFSHRAVESFIPPKAESIFRSEEDVKRMLNERVFERLYSVVYRMLPGEEAEREVASLLDEYARCIWHEIKAVKA